MANVTELAAARERAELLSKEIKEFGTKAENGELYSDADIQRFDEAEAEHAELTKKIATLERLEKAKSLSGNTNVKRSDSFGAPAIRVARKANRADFNNALRAWALYGKDGLSIRDEWKRSCDLVDCNYEEKVFNISRAQSSDVEGAGQEFRDGSIFQSLVEAKAFTGTILEACEIINSSDGRSPIHFVVNDDTSTHASYSAQNATVANTGLTYDTVTLDNYVAKTGVYPVSITLLQDHGTDVLGHLNNTLGRRLQRTLIRDVTIADGSNKPHGFAHAVEANIVAHGLNGVGAEALRAAYYACDKEYRDKAVWSWHDSTNEHLENTLVDDAGQPIWGVGLNGAPIESLRGKRVLINNYLDEIATEAGQGAKKVIFFGDFSHHKVRMIGSPTLVRDDSRLVDTLSVFFAMYQRFDSEYVNPGNDPIVAISTGVQSGD